MSELDPPVPTLVTAVDGLQNAPDARPACKTLIFYPDIGDTTNGQTPPFGALPDNGDILRHAKPRPVSGDS